MSKVPVTENALMKRINRALSRSGEAVKRNRAPNPTLGKYYRVDRFAVASAHVELEKLGRELGVLASYEAVTS